MSRMKDCPACGCVTGQEYEYDNVGDDGVGDISMVYFQCSDCSYRTESHEDVNIAESIWNRQPYIDRLRASLAEAEKQIEKLKAENLSMLFLYRRNHIRGTCSYGCQQVRYALTGWYAITPEVAK